MIDLDRSARLDGFAGTLVSHNADGGEWAADLEPLVLVHLLQAAATGAEVSLDDVAGVRRVVIRRCWYDVEEQSVRATFELSGLAA